jgi:hypothetical protein
LVFAHAIGVPRTHSCVTTRARYGICRLAPYQRAPSFAILQRARPLGSSAYVERRAAHLWTMRGGKAMGLEIFPRREKALEAAGLADQDGHADAP